MGEGRFGGHLHPPQGAIHTQGRHTLGIWKNAENILLLLLPQFFKVIINGARPEFLTLGCQTAHILEVNRESC